MANNKPRAARARKPPSMSQVERELQRARYGGEGVIIPLSPRSAAQAKAAEQRELQQVCVGYSFVGG